MGLYRGQVRSVAAPTPVKRVIRNGNSYTCGICRKNYNWINDAHSCLSRCMQALLVRDGIKTETRGAKTYYRCALCARDYEQRSEAAQCLSDCKAQSDAKHRAEQELSGVSPQVTTSSPTAPVKAQPRPRLVAKPSPSPTVKAPADAPTPAPATVEPVKAKRAPRDRTKKFYRDGAKYVCVTCNQRFFTKVEVEACFDGHDD